MTSASAPPPAVKLSFAKVAASANTPRTSSRPADKTTAQNNVETQQSMASRGNHQTVKQGNAGKPEPAPAHAANLPEKPTEATGVNKRNSRLMPIPIVRPIPEATSAIPPSVSLVKQQASDDASTQVSSSIGPARQATFDSKSVASATTFAMDEKESLWPDDSASIRAREDEESSAVGTGAPESRGGSDTEARAFSDQLREISTMAPRPVPVEQLTPSTGTPSGAPFGTVLANPAMPTQTVSSGRANVAVPLGSDVVPIPDEKLMEALASHRDRLFVLKLEQDIIDFLRDSQESQMVLPQTNSFYRMLAHKLADYYLLNHTVDTNDTGSAVIIIRAGTCSFPPPLHAIPTSVLANPAPVVITGARRIMRRGGVDGVDGVTTASPSEGPSKATSEAGDGSGSSDLNPDGTRRETSKKAVTREEREAKYKEARERIFGNNAEAEAKVADNSQGDAEISRSSSAAGRKKQNKKQRVPINDEFESRTQFAAALYAQQYGGKGYTMDNSFQSGYPGANVNPAYNGMPQAQMQAMYGPGLPLMMSPPNAASGSFGPPQYMDNMNGNFTGQAYDLSTQFQQSMQMQSYQDATPSSQMSLTMMSPDTNGFSPQTSSPMQAFPPQWQQMGPYQQYYGPPQPGMMAQPYPQHQPMQMPGMLNTAYGVHPGQYPPAYLQGSQHRASFNPQIQSFVPNMHNSPPQMTTPRMPQYAMPVNNPTNQGSYNSSPQGAYQSPRPMPQPSSAHASLPPNPMTYANSPRTLLQQHQQSYPQQQYQPSNNMGSSIAKWGTPSHLPPKPPAPGGPDSQKFYEQSRGPQSGQGLPRMPVSGQSNAAQ